MLKFETVFVLGAGASNEVGLPVGSELASIIREKMEVRSEGSGYLDAGDRDLSNLFLLGAGSVSESEVHEYRKAAQRIREGVILADSIDDFLDQNSHDRFINLYGKAAIVKSILEAERKSKMFQSNANLGINFEDIASTWYVRFLKLLTKRLPIDRLNDIFYRVTFISFNYDRCLELFLFEALQKSYGIGPKKAADICNTAKIFHPYGVVGALPHETKTATVPFGNESENNYLEMAKRIRTYTEEITDHNQLNDIRNVVSNAELIVFLGFGFHPQNLDILTSGNSGKQKEILATALGVSIYNHSSYIAELRRRFNCAQPLMGVDKNCFQLINSYSTKVSVYTPFTSEPGNPLG